MPEEENIGPELIAAVKDIISSMTEIDYDEMLARYLVDTSFFGFREGELLTESNLIAHIIEDGTEQCDEDADFSEIVTMGANTIAAAFDLI